MDKKEIVKRKLPIINSDYSFENCEEFEKMNEEIDKIASEECKRYKGKLGYCHIFWATKKRLFKEMYNIDWLSPADRNPHIIFD